MILKFLEYISYIKMKKSGPSSGSLLEKKCILLSVTPNLPLMLLPSDALPIDFNWTVDQEILLFEAMMGHKPVGVDKNIHMICIHR